MVPDWFSVYEDEAGHKLARIHLKVDFAEETAWAHAWSRPEQDAAISRQLCSYLQEGFDAIERWSGDSEAWHAAIGHYGYSLVVSTMTLIPALAGGVACGERFWNVFEPAVRGIRSGLVVPTFVGALSEALGRRGIPCARPRVATATVGVPLQDALAGRWTQIASLLDDYR